MRSRSKTASPPRTARRWTAWIATSLFAIGIWVAPVSAQPPTPPAVSAPGYSNLMLGADISALDVLESRGARYRCAARPTDLIDLLVQRGWTCFRLRLFVDPDGRNIVVNDLPYTLALAERIHDAGASWMLDIHYSDSWADPGHQTKPAAWKDLPFDELAAEVRSYTETIIAECRERGVLPEFVQIGNEITPGFLWPDGKLDGSAESWQRFTTLLRAGVEGVRAGSGGETPPLIVFHTDTSGNWNATNAFFSKIAEHEVPFDVVGLSYYPWWHGSTARLEQTMRGIATELKKPVLIVETAYPHARPVSVEYSKNLEFATTPTGQRHFLENMLAVLDRIPENRGLGLMWWYPEAVPVASLHVWCNGTNALVDEKGSALPAVSVRWPESERIPCPPGR